MRRVSTRLGELGCILVDALAEGSSPSLAIVLCHGYGAPGTDLVPLGSELLSLRPELAQQALLVFPAAPLELGFGGRAWFPLEEEMLMRWQRNWEQNAAVIPEGLPAARRTLMGTVAALSAATKLPYSRIVLGGFSQGAMVTTDVALRLEEAPAGLCLLSGTLVSAPEWKARAASRTALPVFQSHGQSDPLLPFQAAEALRDLLTGAGLKVEFTPFNGPHTIVPEELEQLAEFLVARLPAR